VAWTGRSPVPEGASGGSEDERLACRNSPQIMTEIVQGSSWFWLMTNSDEVNLSSQMIDKKIDRQA